jgi:hypothetical protein
MQVGNVDSKPNHNEEDEGGKGNNTHILGSIQLFTNNMVFFYLQKLASK